MSARVVKSRDRILLYNKPTTQTLGIFARHVVVQVAHYGDLVRKTAGRSEVSRGVGGCFWPREVDSDVIEE